MINNLSTTLSKESRPPFRISQGGPNDLKWDDLIINPGCPEVFKKYTNIKEAQCPHAREHPNRQSVDKGFGHIISILN